VTEYLRPLLPDVVFYDDAGAAIPYGARWGDQSPPEDSYSRVSNLDRFTPLDAVAEALISWLQSTFDVDTVEGDEVAADLLHPNGDVTKAVRLTPRDPASASLTFVLTAHPGVLVHAGALHDFFFPVCTCDACDENVESLADELEWTVRTVIAGRYLERLDRWPSQWIEYRLDEPGVGMRSGRSRTHDLPAARLRAAKHALPSGGQWAPWPHCG
jgi:hypothetical protein